MNKLRHTKSLLKPNYALIATTIIGFAAFKTLTVIASTSALYGAIMVFVLASTIYVCRKKLNNIPAANEFAIQGIAVLIGIYVLISSWTLPGYVAFSYEANLFILLKIACILFLLGSLRIAPLALPGLLLLVVEKSQVSAAVGLPVSSTDYMPLIEFASILAIAPIAAAALSSVRHRAKQLIPPMNSEAQYWLLLIAVAAHCANYLFSAIQKIAISDPAWSWVLQNDTQNLMLAAYETGSLPLSIFGDEVVDFVYAAMSANVILLNASTMMIQLSPLFTLRSIKSLIATMILFDITHIVIFLVTGIFFYKWIILNAIIVTALIKLKLFSFEFKEYLLLNLAMIFAPAIFFVAFLGWHDTPSYNDEYFVAHTESGESFRVPTNYFLASSVTYAQGRISPSKPGHFTTGAMGVLYNAKTNSPSWLNAYDCRLENAEGSRPILTGVISGRIREHHKFILSKLDNEGHIGYDIYPHHIWSMPWSHKEFNELDKRKISSYSYVIESKCLDTENGPSNTPRVLLKTEIEIDVRSK